MSRFIFEDNDEVVFNSPQEMYEDYKKKKIKGVLDYQSEVLSQYIEEKYLSSSNVALELPTGSGKTLVGLLIAEYRRRKFNERVVYVCPNNQLVNQVVKQANEEYDIPAMAFTGSRSKYSQSMISSYSDCNQIAVTNYSSIFNINSFFKDADIIIFDDAHSAEGYIAENWTVKVDREKDSDLFSSITMVLKNVISSNSYLRLTEELDSITDENWCDMVPRIKIEEVSSRLIDVIEPRVIDDDSKKYSWANIKYNLDACNFYLSRNQIMIRPLIPPTQTLDSFVKPKQRIYMSATLGVSGELERTVGVSNIKRLSLSENRVPSIGRRFFIFPNAKFEPKNNFKIFSEIKEHTERALILTESSKATSEIVKSLKKHTASNIYEIEDLTDSFEDFKHDENGVAVLANRYDGLNMQDDLCHYLLIYGLPSTTSLQEKFFTTKLSTAVLFNERMRTRVTQAVGRCTRSTNDYAVVLIIGKDLQNMISPKGKSNLFSPELRAEMETGYAVSQQVESIEDLVETATLGFTRDGEWNAIDSQIIKQRNRYRHNQNSLKYNEELMETSRLEVEFQYFLWRQNYEEAIRVAMSIIDVLKSPELGGYKQYWNYEVASVYNLIFKEKNEEIARVKANEYYERASKQSGAITWFRNLKIDNSSQKNSVYDSTVSDTIDKIENNIIAISEGKRNLFFEKEFTETIKLLKDTGIKFEQGVEKLGKYLGYNSGNPAGKAEPDVWWTLNSSYCIVTESKIYKSLDTKIPAKHVRQSATHPNWIMNNSEKLLLEKDSVIVNVFISNATTLDNGVRDILPEMNYINQEDLIKFAERKLPVISEIVRSFTSEGDLLWRLEAERILKENELTPNHVHNFVTSNNLVDLE